MITLRGSSVFILVHSNVVDITSQFSVSNNLSAFNWPLVFKVG